MFTIVGNNIDLWNGFGNKVETNVFGGEVGIMFDGRSKDSSGNIRYRHGLFFAQYGSSSVTELSDLQNTFAVSDSDGYVCVYATGDTNGDIVIKNRLGHTTNICVTAVRFLGN